MTVREAAIAVARARTALAIIHHEGYSADRTRCRQFGQLEVMLDMMDQIEKYMRRLEKDCPEGAEDLHCDRK
jgi:hypothetical protein